MSKIDINQSPYFDDFNETKKHVKILFRPSRPVQVRELNQLQTLIKNQIDRFGSHIFENGAQVFPGGPDAVRFDNDVHFVKIAKTSFAETLDQLNSNWLNQDFVSSNGVKGTVIGVREADTLDEARLYVKYTNASTSGAYQTMLALESFSVLATGVSATVVSNGIGKCTAVTCEESIYFFNGNFILVDKQTIFITPDDPEIQADWNIEPSCRVGLDIVESIVTYEDDASLLDNATGSTNEFAPGADRLAVTATLTQKSTAIGEDENSFIELMRISSGVVQLKVIKTEYSVLEDTLARRTYDESGDYTVRPFIINAKPFLKEDDNGGVHNESEFYYDIKADAEAAAVSIFGIIGASIVPTNGSKWLPGISYDAFLTAARGKLSLIAETGKAYVKGFEIEKLAPTVIDIDRARTLKYQTNKAVNCNLGPFIYIKNLYGIPNIEAMETIELHADVNGTAGSTPANKIGTAKAIAIEYYTGTHGDPTTGVYKLYLTDIQADAGKDLTQIKSVYCASPSFTADLVLEEFKMSGSITSVGTAVTGQGTTWVNEDSQKLVAGDYVKAIDGAGNVKYRKVASTPTSDTALTLSSAFTSDITVPTAFYYVYALINGLNNESGLVYRLPDESIYTLRGNGQDNIVSNSYLSTYSVRRINSVSANGSGVITLPTLGAGEVYADYSPNDYVVVQTSGSITTATTWLNLTDSNVTPAGSNCTITGGVASANYIVISTVRKESGSTTKERSKTLIRDSFVTTNSSTTNLSEVSLAKCDILAIKNIYMAPDFATAATSSHTDITDRYTLDNGQRDYYYDVGFIKLKAGAQRPTGQLRIVFDYFTHGNDGNYFSPDSYPFKTGGNMTYEEIPVYNSVANGGQFDLKNCIDFRCRVDETDGVGFDYVSELPRGLFTTSYHHYLNRVDKLYLDKTGEFKINYGTPDVNPVPPAEVPTGMTIYDLYVKAYTATPEDCVRKFVENKRYTMRDIGKLERRISNLEYYTQLTLLEKETAELEITDALGQNRFKNGILVDNFSGHSVGDTQSPDYKCSIDMEAGELRPIFHSDNVNLIEKNSLEVNSVTRDQLREEDHYQKTGDVYSLPYTESAFISQLISTKVININPFAVFTFVGRVKLIPWSDEWYDTENAPRLLVEDNNSFDSISAGLKKQGTIWGEWTTNWTGKETTTEKRGGPVVKRGPNRPDANHKFNWPVWRQRITRVTETETGTKARDGFRQEARITGTIEQSLGKKIINQYAAPYIRSREVTFEGKAFLPGTRLYPFFDDVNVSAYCKPTDGAYGASLIADSTGTISGVFKIPNSVSQKFETGDRIFRLTSDSNNSKDPRPSTHGESNYVAKGIINVEQETVLSTRQFEIVTVPVSESEAVSRVNQFDIPGPVVKEDPIAQSFVITEKGGCFITSVNLYFYSKDPVVPVKLQVRPLGPEGTPINKVVPFGEVVKPAVDVITNVVNITEGYLEVSGSDGPWTAKSGLAVTSGVQYPLAGDTDKDMIPTTFVFDSPVYLQEGEDYTIVLLADSTAYNVWVSQYGPDITNREGPNSTFRDEGTANTAIGTQNAILKDPYIAGSFFKSANGRSWLLDPTLDLKFELNKAVFDTSTSGVIEYVNDELPFRELSSEPFIFTDGDDEVRIKHENHGMVVASPISSKVVFSPGYGDLTGTVSSSGTTVTGTGTSFLTELVAGSVIKSPTGEQRRVVGAPASNTSLTINAAFSPNLSAGTSLLGTSYSVPTGASLAGIEVLDLIAPEGFEITSCDLDSYTIDLASNATASGAYGGSKFYATENKTVHTANVVFANLNFSETSTALSISTTTGSSVHADYQTPYLVQDFRNIEPNTDIEFDVPMMISSEINEHISTDTIPGPSTANPLEFFTDLTTADTKSLKAKVILRSTNPNLSPIIDSSRLSVITVANRVDDPSNDVNVMETIAADSFQAIPTTLAPAVANPATLITWTNATGVFSTANADVARHLSKLDVGKYLTIASATTGGHNIANSRIISVVYDAVAPSCVVTVDGTFTAGGTDASTTMTIIQKDRYIDEKAPLNGSVSSKYITKRLNLARSCRAFKVSFDAYRDESSTIDVYYKVLRNDDSRVFDDIEYSKAEFNLDVNGTLTEITPEASTSPTDFSTYETTVNDLSEFIAIAIKVVIRGTNPARPVRIRDFKLIAIDE